MKFEKDLFEETKFGKDPFCLRADEKLWNQLFFK